MEAKGIAGGSGLLAVVVSVLLAVAAFGAANAQATLSPYPSAGFPQANGSITNIVASGNTVYVGGYFTRFGGQARNHLAAFDLTTGAVLPWDPDADANINTMAVYGSDIVVGGDFIHIGGEYHRYVARINATTGALRGWNPDPNSGVRALQIYRSEAILGGSFTSIGGTSRRYLAKINLSSASLSSWNPNGVIGGSTVYALAMSGSEIIVGGSFTNINGTTRNRIAKIGADSGILNSSWNPNASDSVYDLAVSGSDVIAAGNFTTIGGQPRNRLAKIDSSGSTASWNPNPDNTPTALALYGTNVLLAGYFVTLDGAVRERAAMLDSAGNVTSWDPRPNSSVQALAVSGTTVIVGGDFSTFDSDSNGAIANRLAVFKDVQKPSNTSRPQITGSAALNGALNCSTGSWTAGDANLIESYTYSWARNGQAISGAASNTYTVGASDLGKHLSCTVMAANFVGSSSATSDSVTVSGSSGTDPVAPVTIEPSATFSRPVSGTRVKRVRKLQGTVDDGATRVEVAVQKVYYSRSKSKRGTRTRGKVVRRCRVLKKNSSKGRRFTKRSSCSLGKLKWLKATIVSPTIWRLKLRKSLSGGNYKLYVRAFDSAGNVSTSFNADKKNLVRFKAR